jgi:hypothetical protein
MRRGREQVMSQGKERRRRWAREHACCRELGEMLRFLNEERKGEWGQKIISINGMVF